LVGGVNNAQQQKDCVAAWKQLPRARKLTISAEAAAQSKRLAEVSELDFCGFCAVEDTLGGMKPKYVQAVKRRCVGNTMGKMKRHAAWSNLGEVPGYEFMWLF